MIPKVPALRRYSQREENRKFIREKRAPFEQFFFLTSSGQVENETRAQLPSKQGTSPEQTSALEESIYKLSGQLSTINRMQKYFRTRENRNFSTVKSTEGRIFNFSVVESGLMVCMAGLQVFIVRFFFQGARKGTCFIPFSSVLPLQSILRFELSWPVGGLRVAGVRPRGQKRFGGYEMQLLTI